MNAFSILFKKFLVVSIIVLFTAIFIAGCNNTQENEKFLAMKESDLYREALKESSSGSIDAVKKLSAMIQVYPKSPNIEKAQILKAYIYYINEKFDDVVTTVNEYELQYKHSSNLAYMKYLSAMSYYSQLVDEGRDQKMTVEAMLALKEVMEKFPRTEYAKDAKWKYDYAFNLLAGKEIAVGRFYLKQNNHVAAINRFKTVLDLYSTSVFTPETLYRMCEAYIALGVKSEATVYAAVLAKNFPNSIWHQKAYTLLNSNLSHYIEVTNNKKSD